MFKYLILIIELLLLLLLHINYKHSIYIVINKKYIFLFN